MGIKCTHTKSFSLSQVYPGTDTQRQTWPMTERTEHAPRILFSPFWALSKTAVFELSKPLFQSEAKCEDEFVYSHAIKAHFQKRGFALSLVLTTRVCGTRKWLICDVHFFATINSNYVTTYYGEQILRQGQTHQCITFIPQD